MSTQNIRNKNNIKKIKLDEVNEKVSCIAEYKRCATLKYCKENGIEKNNLDELFIFKQRHISGL